MCLVNVVKRICRVFILSGCISKPTVQNPKALPPPAWMMQPPPDLLTPLSEIIGYSESELHSQSK
ncbi:Rz1 family lipoprotein [Proteus sp. NMG38-2]|nr:Rz1 family lipoprotein [Proteus sp. NMG38-2]UDN37409.1 Rz1 family lipoprotein [Proteus sp. NMG38-2]